MRAVILVIAALGLFAAHGAAGATPLADNDEVSRPADTLPAETIAPASTSSQFEHSDCAAQDALCRAACAATDQDKCLDRCVPQLAQCLAALPVGKSVALPTACLPADQEAVRRIERQGELLDADPTLFAESFSTLVRARIACRAGRASDALNFYDEIHESLREKAVPDTRAMETRRAD
jgi:hypothetical protein